MKNKKITFALVFSSLLTACGSSSSGPSSEAPVSIEPSVSHKVKPIFKEVKRSELNSFKLGDKTITLIPDDLDRAYLDASSGTYNGKPTTKRVVAIGFRSSIGVIMEKDKDVVIFSQGQRTSEKAMSTRSGIATYYGPYINYNSKSDMLKNGALGAKVYFSDKKIQFEDRTPSSTSKITLPEATISGNSFIFNDNNGKGYFYGEDSKDISGIYQKGDSHTVFTMGKTTSP